MLEKISSQRLTVTAEMYAEFGEEHAIAYIATPGFWGGILSLLHKTLSEHPDDETLQFVFDALRGDLHVPEHPYAE